MCRIYQRLKLCVHLTAVSVRVQLTAQGCCGQSYSDPMHVSFLQLEFHLYHMTDSFH